MSAVIQFIAPPGQTLTLLVCPWDSLAPANGAGDAATETARAGVYQSTVDETPALSGWHTAHVVSSAGWELPAGDVKIVDGETCRVGSRNEVDAEELAADLAPLIWSNSERTLTIPAQIPDDETSVATITRRRGDTWSISITGLGSLIGRDELWWTIKRSRDDSDAGAIYQATEGLGITVDDAAAGNITLRLSAAVTALIPPRTYYYDVQLLLSDGTVQTLAEGRFEVLADVTRATALPEAPD